MNIELLRQFGQRLLAPHATQSHLCLECRRMIPAGSSAHRLSCSAAILAAVRQKRHLSNLFKNPEPALPTLPWDRAPVAPGWRSSVRALQARSEMDRCLNAKRPAPAGGAGLFLEGSVQRRGWEHVCSLHQPRPNGPVHPRSNPLVLGRPQPALATVSGRGARTSGVTSCSSLVAVCSPSLPRSARRRLGGIGVWLREQDLNL